MLALAQSRPMGNRKKLGETYLNYTVPKEYGGAKCCQAGSTFKVFTLAAALEQGLPADHVVRLAVADDVRPRRLLELPRRAGLSAATPSRSRNSTSSG